MTDELLNSNSDDLVSNPVINIVTPLPTEATAATSCDKDYQSDTETEKPVLLELGTATNIPLGSAVSIYPLDIQVHNVSGYINPPTYMPATDSSLLSAQLYSNPYTYTSAVGNVIRNRYPSHIPQTVCNWSTSDHVETRATAEIVPPPMYVSYIGSRELSIVKEANPSWKEKALQIEKDYKKTACDRERTRMRDMNRAFDLLRSKLPISKPNGKKYSKIESLRIAINYIHHLQNCLKADSLEATSFSMANKTSIRGSGTDYILETNTRRQIYQFGSDSKDIYDETEREHEKTHNGAWSENSYLPHNQDQWD